MRPTIRHARACPGHPRLWSLIILNRHPEVRAQRASKDESATVGSSSFEARNSAHLRVNAIAFIPGMTEPLSRPLPRKHLFQDLPADRLVVEGSVVPPPAVALHLLTGGNKAISDRGKIRIGVVEAEDQPAGADPAQRQPLGAQVV